MKTAFYLVREFPVSAKTLYEAWLDSETHSAMTGGEAHCSSEEGMTFSAWDGYIQGTNVTLEKPKLIIQKWRTVEFGEGDPDSNLKIEFKDIGSGSELKITHSEIPEGQPDYHQGWIDNYLDPMEQYFNSIAK